MTRKELIIVIILGVGILGLLLSSLLEYREESDLDWKSKFTYDSKDPYGAWMFDNMVKSYFDSNKVVYHYRDTLLSDLDTTGMLYIMFGNRFTYRKEETSELIDFVRRGNSALIIGKSSWTEDSTNYFSGNYAYSNKDSILNFYFENDMMGIQYSYAHYVKGFDEKKFLNYRTFDLAASAEVDAVQTEYNDNTYSTKVQDKGITNPLGSINGHTVYLKTDIDSGSIYQHTVPEMFINHASKQDYYVGYLNKIFESFDPEFVVLDHPSFNKMRSSGNTNSPLQFILSQKPLRTAYYLILVSSLLFVIFKSKRKQRAIPVLEKNRNTTLEYVETLSNLFSSQNQSARLIPHIKNYFYHTVKKKYYLDEKNPDFVKLLSKKSKFDYDELQIIVKMLDNADKGYAYPDDQLINLHRRVEIFYKTAK